MKVKTFNKYIEKIKKSDLQENDIIALRKHLNGYGKCPPDDEERATIFSMVDSLQPIISQEQTAKGLAWLKNQYKTPTGKERKYNPFGIDEQGVLEDFRRFRLIGFQDQMNSVYPTKYHNYMPIYRVESFEDESYFDYVPQCWQSQGPQLQIV